MQAKPVQYIHKFLLLMGAVLLLGACHSSHQLIDPIGYFNKSHQVTPIADAPDSIILAGSNKKMKVVYDLPEESSGPIYTFTMPEAAGVAACINNSDASYASLQLKYADILGLSPDDIVNICLYNFIDKWYGVKYKYGGTDESGIDCSAFVQLLYGNVFCVDLVRTSLEQFRHCRYIKKRDSLQEGHLVFFKTRGRKRINHVGIYLANDYFVHASSSGGVMISNLADSYWSRVYAGAGAIYTE